MSTVARGFPVHLEETLLPPFSSADATSLAVMGTMLEPDLPWLARVLADEAPHLLMGPKDPLARREPPEIAVLNRRRRAARSFLVHLFQGDLGEEVLRTLRSSWLPDLVTAEGRDFPPAAAAVLEFARGLVAGGLHQEPQENLVPMVRIQGAIDQAFRRMRAFLSLRD